MKSKRDSVTFIILFVSVIGALTQFRMMQTGISLWEDSYDYITAAINLVDFGQYGRLDGLGNFKALTHFPPLYSFLLAIPYSLSIDILLGAKWINCLFFGVNIFLIGLTVYTVSRSAGWAVFATILAGISESLINTHLWALSEPVYFTWTLLALLSMSSYLSSKKNNSFWLYLSALLTSLAILTRYAGVTLLFTTLISLLITSNRKWLQKLRSSIIFLIFATFPNLIFLLRNFIVSSTLTDDPGFSWHPPLLSQWQQLSKMILNWLLPDVVIENISGSLSLGFTALIFICLVTFSILILKKGYVLHNRSQLLLTLHILHLILYVGVFLATVFVWRRITPADRRLISPIYLSVIIIIPSYLGSVWKSLNNRMRTSLLIITSFFFTVQVLRYRNIFIYTPEETYGLSASKWESSDTLAYLRSLDNELIYSNEIQAIYFYANHNAIFIPTFENPATGQPRDDYEHSLAQMRSNLSEVGGVLALFYPERLEENYLRQLTEGLTLIASFEDGVIYNFAVEFPE